MLIKPIETHAVAVLILKNMMTGVSTMLLTLAFNACFYSNEENDTQLPVKQVVVAWLSNKNDVQYFVHLT